MLAESDILGVAARPGVRTFGYADVSALADGARLQLPVHIVRGPQPGPTLLLGTTAHGDEIANIMTVRDLLEQVAPSELSGTLVAVPLMNPPAFETQTAFTKLDDWSLDEAFPVTSGGMLTWARGWATQQIASTLAQLVQGADYAIELRSGTHNLVSNAVAVRTGGELELELANVFGADAVYETTPPEATLADFAANAGVPLITAEIGGGYPHDERLSAQALRGVLNVMHHVRMLPGQPERPSRQRRFGEQRLIRSRNGGMFYPAIGAERLNEMVPRGTRLGRIVHPLTLEEIELVTAPYEQTYLLMLRGLFSTVHPGDVLYRVADLEKEQNAYA
jgi:uncharacterized protein